MGKDVGENETLQISRQQKMINSKVEIFGIKIDRKLSFHQHVKSISKKASFIPVLWKHFQFKKF